MAAITHLDVGDTWVPQATFTVSGTPTDPTTLTLKIRNAAGTITTITENTPAAPTLPIVRVSAGVFKHNGITLDASGYWAVKFTGTGAAAASETHEAIVDPDPFTSDFGLSSRALVSMAETKDWLNQQNIDTSNDLDLARVINDISDRMIEESGGREFKAFSDNPATRVFEVEPMRKRDPWYIDGQWMGDRDSRNRRIRVGDLTSFTAVSLLASSDWATVVEAVTPLAKVESHPLVRAPWEPIRELEFRSDVVTLTPGMRVSVTGTWGFPSVPGNVRQAVLDAVAAIMDRDVEHYRQDMAPAAGAQEGGTVVMVGGGAARILALPPSSQAVAWSYRAPCLG